MECTGQESWCEGRGAVSKKAKESGRHLNGSKLTTVPRDLMIDSLFVCPNMYTYHMHIASKHANIHPTQV